MNRLFGNWPQQSRWLHRSLVYLLVGMWNTLFGFGVYYLTLIGLKTFAPTLPRPYLYAMTVAQILGVLNAFIAHRKHTFADRRSSRVMSEFLRFSLVYLATLVLSYALLSVMIEGFTIRPDLAGAINIIATTLLSYVAHLRFSFRNHKS